MIIIICLNGVSVMSLYNIGWWLVSKNGSGKKELGYISANFLKLHEDKDVEWRTSKEESNGMFDTSKVDSEMKYVAIEDYSTSDSRQLSFCQGDLMVILEKCEDGNCTFITKCKTPFTTTVDVLNRMVVGCTECQPRLGAWLILGST